MAAQTEILMNISSFEQRVAVVKEGALVELHIARDQSPSLIGNIYQGKVLRIMPGMQAAFVDIGMEKAGFLHLSEVVPYDAFDSEEDHISSLNVYDYLHEGQVLGVQVIKDAYRNKGARLSAHLSLASRSLVLMPGYQRIAVSLKLSDENERERLSSGLETLIKDMNLSDEMGFIIRTVAEGVETQAFEQDVRFLLKLYEQIKQKMTQKKKPGLIYENVSFIHKVIRDLLNDQVDKVQVDNQETYQDMSTFVEQFAPELQQKLHFYNSSTLLFERYGIEKAIMEAFSRTVSLPSGGYIAIDQTEAMSCIDVNTGSCIGKGKLDDSLLTTNLEAAQEIAKQLCLRQIGGIIVIDFIDMIDVSQQERVLETLQHGLSQDRAPTTCSGFSDLGLVEVSRKRSGESLLGQCHVVCPSCAGSAWVKSLMTIEIEILRAIEHQVQLYPNIAGFMVVANQEVLDYVLEESQGLAELEAKLNLPIRSQINIHYGRETFDIVLL